MCPYAGILLSFMTIQFSLSQPAASITDLRHDGAFAKLSQWLMRDFYQRSTSEALKYEREADTSFYKIGILKFRRGG
jgi:hypothetical protein